MDELIKILDKNLTYLNHEILEDTIYITIYICVLPVPTGP